MSFIITPAWAGSKSGSNSSNVEYTTAWDWVWSGISISGAPAGAEITSIVVSWNVDSNYISDIRWYVENYGNYESSTYSMSVTGDDWWDGYDETSESSRTIYPPSNTPVNGNWYFNIRDEYNDSNPDWNKGRIDSWRITIYYTDPKPDLIVDDIWVTPDPRYANQSATINVRIKNQGAGDASQRFYLKYYVDGTYIGDDDLYWGLNAGDTDDESISYTVSTSGNHQIRVDVDTTYVIDESNESNNSRRETHYWNPEPQPDLIVQDIDVSSPRVAGQPATITATIKNQGSVDAGSFKIKYYVDGSYIGEDTLTFGLNAGQSDPETISYTASSSGNHTIKVVADSSYQISESNESNNTREETFFWSEPDPILTINTDSLDFGSSDTEHTFTIRNTGGGTLTWTITDNKPWIDVSPASGSTTTETDTITVTVNRSHPDVQNVNTYTGVVTVSPNNGPAQTVDVTMDVEHTNNISGYDEVYELWQSDTDCGPVSAVTLLGYWDEHTYNGITYWNLIDHGTAFNGKVGPVDNPGSSTDGAVQDMRDAMGWNTGDGVGPITERDGIESYTNDSIYMNNLQFDANADIDPLATYNTLKNEMDAGRPVLQEVHLYFYFEIPPSTGTHWMSTWGYRHTPDYKFTLVHDNWDISADLVWCEWDEAFDYPGAAELGTIALVKITPSGIPEDHYDPDNDMASAKVVDPYDTYNFRQTHNFKTGDTQDWIWFTGEAGKRYTIETTNLGANSDPVIQLWRDDGSGSVFIDEDDDSGVGNNAKIVWTCYDCNSTTLYMKVWDYYGNTGHDTNYDIEVSFEDVVVPDTPSPISPLDGETISTLTPSFEWSAFQDGGDGATQAGYQLRVRCDDCGDIIVYDTGFIADTTENTHSYNPGAYTGTDPDTGDTRVSDPLEWGTHYHWHVRYKDSNDDWSHWSADNNPDPHQDFFTATPPDISPIDNQAWQEAVSYTGPTPVVSGTQPFTWSLVDGPSGMTINDSSGVVSWPNPTVVGSPHIVTIRATNNAGSDDESWLLTVDPVVIPPVINPISNDSITEGTPYTGPTPSLSQGTLPVTWSLQNGPSGMTINSSTGVVSWTNPTVSGSPHTITIRATNTAGYDDESWQLTVDPVIVPPVINPISNDSTVEGTPYTGPTPSLSQGTLPVTWSLQNGPSGMTINSSTGVVSWTNPTVSGSPHTITIRATNTAGYDDESWQLTVDPDVISDYYVAPPPVGDDGNDGTSPTSPFATVQHAIDVAQGSETVSVTIHVAVGTYTENVVMDNWESIEGGWDSDFTQRWDFENDGIKPTASYETIIDGMEANNVIVASGNSFIEGFTIKNAGFNKAGIFSSNSGQEPLIRYNVITGYTDSGVWIYEGSAVIQNNWIHDLDGSNGIGISVYTGEPFICNNVIVGNKGHGIYAYSPHKHIYNNTIYGNGGWAIGLYQDAMVLNNIVCQNSGGIFAHPGFSGQVDYNDVWGNDTWGNYNDGVLPYLGSGEIHADPIFGTDYHLQAGSPCINAGDPASASPAFPANDIDGEARPQGSGYDIGADEFFDSDGDDIPDYWEYKWFENLDQDETTDWDEDGLTDLEEFQYATHPNDSDTDDDGWSDGDEVAAGTDPNDPEDYPEPDITVTDSIAPADDLDLPFGEVQEGDFSEATVTVTNDGTADLAIYDIASANPLESPFSIESDTCSNGTVPPGASCSLTVRFNPDTTDTFSDSFDIPSDDPDENPVTVNVSGTGTQEPTITVTSPNGGESWQAGTSHSITWTSSNVTGDVMIELYRGSTKDSTITSSISNDGSYSWSIPPTQPERTDYRIKVTSISDTSVYDYSNYFSITQESTPVIEATPSNRNVSWDAGFTTFNVSNAGGGSMSWTASVTSGGSWLSIMSGSSGMDAGTIQCSYEENTGSVRTGTIRVVAPGATGSPMDVTVTQEGFVSGGTLKWSFSTGGSVKSSPAIGSDGTIYVASTNNKIYAINPDGTQKWVMNANSQAPYSPAIGSDGTIYIRLGPITPWFYAINSDGTLKWGFMTWGEGSSPAIGKDGIIYVGSDNYLEAINPDGTERWDFETGGTVLSSPAISSDGTIYVGSYDGNLYAIKPDGSLKWSYPTGSAVVSSPAISSDGTIYVGSRSNNKIYAINPDGTQKWVMNANSQAPYSPAIGSDGTIYIRLGPITPWFYAINPDGTLKWGFMTWGEGSSPAIGKDGTIYVGSDKYLQAINPDGTEKWDFETGGTVLSSPAIATDGTVYVGSNDGNLYAINGESGGLADSPWPMFRHDLKRTGRSSYTEGINAMPWLQLLLLDD